jgi:RsiW-degrading membrane proteinase PrsW (M82 family)
MAEQTTKTGAGKAAQQVRKSVLQSSLITFAALGIFLALSFGVDRLLKPEFTQTSLVWVGAGMSLIPSLLWLSFFYRQDQHEPEPKGMVIQVFILGGLLAAAVGIPLVNDVFQVSAWLDDSLAVNIAGAILVVGFTQEFLKFAAVRFSIFNAAEFDERTDGIIYATAAGLGYATVLNIHFIIDSGGASIGMAAIRLVLTALAQASFAGITGYFLARQKFEKRPLWWLPLGLLIASALNGLFFTLWGHLSTATFQGSQALVNPWLGLGLAIVLSLLILVVLSWLIRRDQLRSSSHSEV